MKANLKNHGFTLLELMTVLAVIVVLTAMVVGVAGLVSKRSSVARATTEISMLGLSAEGYKGDNGSYPQGHETPELFSSPIPSDDLKPRKHFRPGSGKDKDRYEKSSLALYRELTGDNDLVPDGKPDAGRPIYLKEFDPRILKKSIAAGGSSKTEIKYLQDPFGYPYGYSTAAAKVEAKFQKDLRNPDKDFTGQRKTGEDLEGFNAATFDLWSTGGSNPNTDPQGKEVEIEQAKWIKNW